MAVGDTLGTWDALSHRPPDSSAATYWKVDDDIVINFDDGAVSATYFVGVLPANYAGGDLEIRLSWAPVLSSGNVKWDVAFERRQPGVFQLDTPDFGAASTDTEAVSAAENVIVTTVTITAANAGTPVAGEPFRFSVTRDTTVGSNMADSAYLFAVELLEA